MAGDSNVLVYLMEYTWKIEQMFGEEMTALNGSLTIDSGTLEREDVEEQGKNYFYYFEKSVNDRSIRLQMKYVRL